MAGIGARHSVAACTIDAPSTDGARHAVRMLGLAQAAAFAVTGITVTIGPLSLHELSGHEGFGGGLLAVFILSGGAGAFLAGRLMRRIGRRACLVASHLAYGAAGVRRGRRGRGALAARHPRRRDPARARPRRRAAGAVGRGRPPPVRRARSRRRADPRRRGRRRPLRPGARRRAAPARGGHRPGRAHAAVARGAGPRRARRAGGLAPPPRAVAAVRGAARARPLAAVAGAPAGGWATPTLVVAGAQAAMLALMSVVPVHIHHQGGGDALMALILGAHLASMYGLAPLLGAGIDRWGHRDGLIAGAGLCVAGAMLGAVTHVPVVAAAGLVALGAGWCASYLGVTAAAGLEADPRDRASALGAGRPGRERHRGRRGYPDGPAGGRRRRRRPHLGHRLADGGRAAHRLPSAAGHAGARRRAAVRAQQE